MSNVQEALKLLVLHQNLTAEMASDVMNDIMDEKVTESEIAAYLMGLAAKKESIPEIVGSAKAMIKHAVSITPEFDAMDIVGTGGDLANTFNISTTASFIVAASGVPIAKHGNRAASSKSGTADVLEALGVNIVMTAKKATKILHQSGQTFLFAREFHPSMRIVGPVRKKLGFRTIFNILGPLTNPARPRTMLLGVYSQQLLVPIAHVLSELGVTDAILIHGQDGLDEITLNGKTNLAILRDGEVKETIFDPKDYGFEYVAPEELLGGTPEENAHITSEILNGKLTGAKANIVILNAGLALYVAKKAATIAEAINLARETLASGAALRQLNLLRALTQEEKS